MIRTKNYETASKFVKGMTRNTVASFFETRCICSLKKQFSTFL